MVIMAQKNARVDLSLTAEQKREWTKLAAAQGLTLTQWIVFRCNGILLVQTERKAA